MCYNFMVFNKLDGLFMFNGNNVAIATLTLGAVFVLLKIAGLISFSWHVVTAPIWIAPVVGSLFIAATVIYAIAIEAYKKLRFSKANKG